MAPGGGRVLGWPTGQQPTLQKVMLHLRFARKHRPEDDLQVKKKVINFFPYYLGYCNSNKALMEKIISGSEWHVVQKNNHLISLGAFTGLLQQP